MGIEPVITLRDVSFSYSGDALGRMGICSHAGSGPGKARGGYGTKPWRLA